jgi:iron(III) transport system ATP-binding protein
MDIAIRNVTKVFGAGPAAVRAVDDVSLHIAAGEFFFLLGPSGCGKTTLLRIVAGLVRADSGRVFFGDFDVTGDPVEKRNTAMMFQSYALWPHMTVWQNVEFGPRMRHLRRRQRRDLVAAQLERVQMEACARRKPNQLSGGQQQRVALARALAAQPACLLLDEPLSNLDARLRLHMRDELRTLVKSTGTTTIYVTHDQKEALSMADRIALMHEGAVVQVGTPEELYNRPRTRFVADFLGEANFIEGKVTGEGDLVEIETSVGTVLAADTRRLRRGARVTCCVRPERIALSRTPQGAGGRAASSIPATIVSATFLGEVYQYRCKLAEGLIWKVTVLEEPARALEPAGDVTLCVAPEDVTVLAD